MPRRPMASWLGTLALAGLGLVWVPESSLAATVLHYDFNETGNAPGSSGTDATPVKLRDDDGDALDFHSADGEGVSGLPGDRCFANTGPSDQGRFASGATNGFRADQPDNPAIDGLTAFTISGWFKTELSDTFLPNATPRLVHNHDDESGSAGDGFNLQFLTGSEGDLKLEVDDDTGSGVDTSGTGEPYSDKQKWVFFAVSYDGTATLDNVSFYVGFRNAAEAGGGPGSAAVALVTTASLDRGAVDAESVELRLANREGNDRPFKGFLDEIRVDDVAHAGPGGLAALESYRQAALAQPLDAELRHVDSWNLDASGFGVEELSGVSYHPDTGNFWAVADDGGQLLEIDAAFGTGGEIVTAAAVSAVTLVDVLDFEGIAFTSSLRNSVFVAEEDNPGVREYDLGTGSWLQTLAVPSVFGDNLRFNRGFEGVARNVDGSELWTGVEQALSVDGPDGTSVSVGTVSRWLRYAVSGNVAIPAEQFAYVNEPAHGTPVLEGSSLSDLVMLPNGSLLALERSDAAGEILVRVFLAERQNATDVSQGVLGNGLSGESYLPVAKTLLYSDDRLGKFEGLAVGPVLENGGIVLLGVEDVNSTSSLIHSFVLSGDFAAPSVPALAPWSRALLLVAFATAGLWKARC